MKPFKNCALGDGGCEDTFKNCSRCGWDWEEAERRKKLPLETDEFGVRKKVIRRATQK